MADTENTEHQNDGSPGLPSWIDKKLLDEALRNSGETNPHVATMSVCCPSAAGDNYASTVYRVTVILSDGKKVSFIVKGPAPGAAMANLASESGIFQREVTLLAEVIPQMEALLEVAAPGRFRPLAPRCYHHGSSPVEFIVLEDLTPFGFEMADRKRGLGLKHSIHAFRTLARFHAASYELLKRHPGLAETLPSIWRKVFANMQPFILAVFSAASEVCRSWPGFEEYADHLDKFKLIAMDRFADLTEAKPGAFNVITHGDFWVNNMMFHYEDGQLKDHRVIDLQISHVASPAVDIVHFFGSSISSNVYEHHRDLLIREYHHELKETMELLGLQAPPLEELVSAVDLHGPLSLSVSMAKPITKSEHGVDVEAMLRGDYSAVMPLFEDPDIKKWMQLILPESVRRGWLHV